MFDHVHLPYVISDHIHHSCTGELVLRERAVAALPRDKFAARLCHSCFKELKGVHFYRVTCITGVTSWSIVTICHSMLFTLPASSWCRSMSDTWTQMAVVMWRRLCRHKRSHALLQ
jgi:hypothetical protein